jgi:hypothetical protein
LKIHLKSVLFHTTLFQWFCLFANIMSDYSVTFHRFISTHENSCWYMSVDALVLGKYPSIAVLGLFQQKPCYISEVATVDYHVPSSKFNRLTHTIGLLLRRYEGMWDRCSTYSPPHRISLNERFGGVGLTQEPCPLRQNHVIIHSGHLTI